MEMLISFTSRTLAPTHTVKTTSKCFADHDITVLDWPASQRTWPEPHLESMGYFQEKGEKPLIQQYRLAKGSIVPQRCHRLITSMPHLADAGVCAKGAPTKYYVQKWTYFKELELFCFANPYFFIALRKYSNILRYRFLTFISCKL